MNKTNHILLTALLTGLCAVPVTGHGGGQLPIIPHMASGASDALHFRAVGIPGYTFLRYLHKSI